MEKFASVLISAMFIVDEEARFMDMERMRVLRKRKILNFILPLSSCEMHAGCLKDVQEMPCSLGATVTSLCGNVRWAQQPAVVFHLI